MPKIGLIGPADRTEIQRLALRLEERDCPVVLVDTRQEPRFECGPDVLRICAQDLRQVSGFYVSDLGLRAPYRALEGGLVDEWASPGALRDSLSSSAAWMLVLEWLEAKALLLNPPRSYDLHGLKVHEVSTYAALGWRAPETFASSDPEALLKFARRSHPTGLVRKDIVGGYGYTELFEPRADTDSLADLLAERPLMLQERIEGDAMRAYVLGGRVLAAARIVPTGFGQVDSRRSGARLAAIELDPKTAERATAVAALWGMPWAAVDFMRDERQKEWVLLECNSGPFFAEFERAMGCDLSGALADHLIGRKPRK